MPVIGYLSPGSPESDDFRLTAFRQGLNEAGYVEGQNVAIEYRWAQGQNDRLSGLAADLVGRQVTVIATVGRPSAFAAKAATSTIPVVFVVGIDPVQAGLVTSLNRPGGNITGVALISAELAAKRLELLHELVPTAAQVALLVNPTNAVSDSMTRTRQDATRSLGLQLRVLRASTPARSRQPSGPWSSSEPLRSSSVAIRSSPTSALKLSLRRPAAQCPRSTGCACSRQPAA
jgi:putative tryptophan/tyrosine transport system substrate-binding protein